MNYEGEYHLGSDHMITIKEAGQDNYLLAWYEITSRGWMQLGPEEAYSGDAIRATLADLGFFEE